jgi:hypothetical protein
LPDLPVPGADGASGRFEAGKPKTGMVLVSHVEVSEERPGRDVNVFAFRDS